MVLGLATQLSELLCLSATSTEKNILHEVSVRFIRQNPDKPFSGKRCVRTVVGLILFLMMVIVGGGATHAMGD